MLEIKIKRLGAHELPLPKYESTEAAGMDLSACLEGAPITLAPGEHCLVPTGFAIALPKGYEAQVRPRSGLAAKYGVSVLNTPGTIDSDYRGEVKVILINHGKADFIINHGERIAQMIIAPVLQAKFIETETLEDTNRGAGGFGSTGK